VDAESLPAAGEEEIYHFEALGLEVRTTAGEVVGEVVEVMPLAANDVWVVRRPARSAGRASEVLIPVVGSVVTEIDLPRRVAVIDPLPGLLDGE
jgi:16S rRNA processing protein RimM